MSFNIGDKVKIRLSGGAIERGEVTIITSTWSVNGGTVNQYGVRIDGSNRINYYTDGDLIKYDKAIGYFAPDCECGSDKIHAPKEAPGHSDWCPKEKWNRYFVG